MSNQPPVNPDALEAGLHAGGYAYSTGGDDQDVALASIQAYAQFAAPPLVTNVAELDELPIHSIVACMGIAPGSRNVPIILVWQRGSVDNGGSDWCMPDTQGQITSTDVFYFLNVNELRQELTVLYRPEVKS